MTQSITGIIGITPVTPDPTAMIAEATANIDRYRQYTKSESETDWDYLLVFAMHQLKGALDQMDKVTPPEDSDT